jgi:quercetin dioxygenase-like cupin family protein
MSALDRPLSGHDLAFRLHEESDALLRSDTCLRAGRSARVLVKEGPMRVTLVAVAPAGGIAAHTAEGPLTAQGITGEVVFRTDDGREHRLGPGDLLALGPGVRHAVESRPGGAFLLTTVAAV